MGLFGRHDRAVDEVGPHTGSDDIVAPHNDHSATGHHQHGFTGGSRHNHPLTGNQQNVGTADTYTGQALTSNYQKQNPVETEYNDSSIAGSHDNTGLTGNRTGGHGLTGNSRNTAGTVGTGYNENPITGNQRTGVADHQTGGYGVAGHHHDNTGTVGTGYNENPITGNQRTGVADHQTGGYGVTGHHHDNTGTKYNENSLTGNRHNGHTHGNHHHHEGAAAGAGALAGAGVASEKHHGRSIFSRRGRNTAATTTGTPKARGGLFGSRTHRNHETTSSMSTTSRPRFGQWLKATWLDLFTMIILGAIGLGVYKAPPAPSRSFPIVFQDGEIVYPQFGYPLRHEIVPIWAAALIATLVPIAVILICQIRVRSFWDVNNGIIGLLYAVITAAVFQVFLKWLIGGLRPHFLAVCKPAVPSSGEQLGNGFNQIYYDRSVCTGDSKEINDALESFPSGHTTAAFAGFVFLYLYLNAKLKVFSTYHPAMWKLVAIYAPILGAVLIAGALTIDEYHNWYDCLGGAIIGTVMAFSAYRMVYAAIWDFRFNHIPLTRLSPFTPNSHGDWESAVFTRKAGFGGMSRNRHHASTTGRDVDVHNNAIGGDDGYAYGNDHGGLTGTNRESYESNHGGLGHHGKHHDGALTGVDNRQSYDSNPGYDNTGHRGTAGTTSGDPLANVTHVNEGRRNSRGIGRRPVGGSNYAGRGDQIV